MGDHDDVTARMLGDYAGDRVGKPGVGRVGGLAAQDQASWLLK